MRSSRTRSPFGRHAEICNSNGRSSQRMNQTTPASCRPGTCTSAMSQGVTMRISRSSGASLAIAVTWRSRCTVVTTPSSQSSLASPVCVAPYQPTASRATRIAVDLTGWPRNCRRIAPGISHLPDGDTGHDRLDDLGEAVGRGAEGLDQVDALVGRLDDPDARAAERVRDALVGPYDHPDALDGAAAGLGQRIPGAQVGGHHGDGHEEGVAGRLGHDPALAISPVKTDGGTL